MRLTRSRLIFALTATVSLAVPLGFTAAGSAAAAAAAVTGGSPQFANAVAFDVSQPFSVLATRPGPAPDGATGNEVEPGDGPTSVVCRLAECSSVADIEARKQPLQASRQIGLRSERRIGRSTYDKSPRDSEPNARQLREVRTLPACVAHVIAV